MTATSKFPAEALPPSVVRHDITRSVTGVMPSMSCTSSCIACVTAKSKPPPPSVPIGPAMPEGQLPPYAIPTQQQQQEQQQQQLSKAPSWAVGAFSVVERDKVRTLPPVIPPLPAPPPRPIGEAPRPSSQRPSSSTIPPESLTPTQAASRQYFTTIAIQPWPIDYDTDSPTSDIARIRSHYGDMHQPQCDRVLVRFSKKL